MMQVFFMNNNVDRQNLNIENSKELNLRDLICQNNYQFFIWGGCIRTFNINSRIIKNVLINLIRGHQSNLGIKIIDDFNQEFKLVSNVNKVFFENL